MRVEKEIVITFVIVIMFIWLFAISFAILELYAYKTFILEELSDIYSMISGIYEHITNLLNMGVSL